MKSPNSLATGMLLAILIVTSVAFMARAYGNGPPQVVTNNIAPIKADQKILAKNRKAHEAFMAAKEDQARREKENNDLHWRTDWKTLQPVPVDFRQPSL